MQGRLSIKLVNPIDLQNILRNVTLGLPEDYELIVGTDIENMYLYYDLNAVSIVANTHCIDLLLHIRLKSANRYFTLFKVITLPTVVSPDKFARYIVEFPYFGLQVSQRAYLMLTEAEYSNCKKKGSINICLAVTQEHHDTAILTCVTAERHDTALSNSNTRKHLNTVISKDVTTKKHDIAILTRVNAEHHDTAISTRVTAEYHDRAILTSVTAERHDITV